MKYIMVVRTCDSCGGASAVGLYSKHPTHEEKRDLKDEIGGLTCITTEVFKEEEEGNYVLIEEK